MRPFSALTSLSLLSLHLQPSLAYWRMACSVSQTSRIDPILNPNTVSGHVHKFAGGNNVDQSSTHQSLLASTCSTCEVQKDKSAYWTPQLYYQHTDGTLEEVQNDGMTVYYVGRGGSSSNTVPFPEGFQMISGNSLLRHYDDQNLTYLNTRPIADRVSFRCINEANNIPETHYLHETNCVNGLRAQLNFQSCWDGVNLYKPGNSHVAYLSGIDYGVCPPSHPIPIPGLFFEVLYWTNRINQSGGGRFVFSNGDTTGFGFHGDFMNGWDQDTHIRAVQQCLYTDNGGIVTACPPLAESVNENFSRICPESPSVFAEAVKGKLPTKQLPGCNPITSGPSDAPQVVCAIGGSTPVIPTSSLALSITASSPRSSSKTMSTSNSSGFSKVSPTTTTKKLPTSSPPVGLTTMSTPVSTSTKRQSSGGIFVTIPNNETTTAPTINVLTVTETQVVTVMAGSLANSTAIASSLSTSTNVTDSIDLGTKTQTTFVTVFSPITVNVTSVMDVTVTETTLARRKKREELVTFMLRGREMIKRRQ